MSENLSKEAIAEIVKLGRQAGTVHTIAGSDLPFVVIPQDAKVESLERLLFNDFRTNPHRKKGVVTVLDAPSFCEYYSLFHDDFSRIFADETKNTFLAVLDYHGEGENLARWGQHRVIYTLRYSEEWQVWKAANGTRFNQMEFAEFIEDNQPDITSPSGSTMLEVARDLQAKSDGDYSSAISQANGSVKLRYTETIKGTYGSGEIDVPERFEITIPIYIGSLPITLTARLRYRPNSGKMQFWFDLLRAGNAERDGFASIHREISSTTGITIINGMPT